MALSERGQPGSSSATSSRIRSLTERLPSPAVPSPVEAAPEKKFLSGKIPRRHCRYFSLIARLTVDS